MTPRVSVLLPVFNAASTLDAAIHSIAQQTLRDFELIIADDGSSDDSPEIAASWAKRDARVRLSSAPHAGIVPALNRAAALASAAYLARMDADDIAHPARLQAQLERMEGSQAGLCGTHVHIFGDRVRSGLRRYEAWLNAFDDPRQIERELFVECPLAHPTFLIRREAFESVGGYLQRDWPEDYELLLRLWAAGWGIEIVPKPLLHWREHMGRLSRRDGRYEEGAFRRLKRHYLFRTHLRAARPFFQWGAGEVGKRWLREWEGGRPEAVVDIRPGKIGQHIHGYRIIAPEELPVRGAQYIVVTVGTPGARDIIRCWMKRSGRCEPQDFCFLA